MLSRGLRGAGCRLQVTGYELQVTSYGFRVSGCRLRVSGFGFREQYICWTTGLKTRNIEFVLKSEE